MMKTSFQPSRISTLALAMACLGGPALAQDAAPAEAQAAAAGNAEPVNGEDIVVTAAAGDKSRFRSSISVSQVSQEAIQNFTPRSEAEVLRSIPGLQPSDTAGPGGNANIGVRGIPVSTGG
ncbi:MAG: TonB-dependent receptor, partial [Sphingobium sp.]